MKRGKKYIEVAKKVDHSQAYDIGDACALVKELKTAKFDETVEAHIRLTLRRANLYAIQLSFLINSEQRREFLYSANPSAPKKLSRQEPPMQGAMNISRKSRADGLISI